MISKKRKLSWLKLAFFVAFLLILLVTVYFFFFNFVGEHCIYEYPFLGKVKVVFLKNRMRVWANKGNSQTNILFDNGTYFVWQEGKEIGMVFDLKNSKQKSTDNNLLKELSLSLMREGIKRYKAKCSFNFVDRSVFKVPEEVKFNNFNQFFQRFP